MTPLATRLTLTALAVCVLGLGAPSAATPMKDQEFILPLQTTAGRVTAGLTVVSWAQTFTVGITGQLTMIEVGVKHSSGTPTDLNIQLRRTTAGGAPSNLAADILATAVIPAASIPNSDPPINNIPGADITSQNVMVSAGEVLAIVMPAALGTTPGWIGMSGGFYTPGSNFRLLSGSTTWTTQGDIDYSFRTFVDASVPEPGTLPMLASALILVVLARRLPVF